MRFRIAWVRCYDCGRRGVDGGCFIVQKLGLLGWRDFCTSYDRDGGRVANHYSTEVLAKEALIYERGPQKAEFRVIREIELP